MNPLCERLIADLPQGSQPNIRSLTVDASLRVKARTHADAVEADAQGATRRRVCALHRVSVALTHARARHATPPLCLSSRVLRAPSLRWATAPPSS